MKKLYFCITMDCERIAAESPTGGPADWEFSEKAIRGFWEILAVEGQRATFFIVPAAAARHRELWRDVAGGGCELGLHVHPQSLGDRSRTEHLGAYGREEQFAILRQARDRWQDALGRAPRAFRPGMFSADDATFGVLADLGFTHGSVSAPQWVAPHWQVDWGRTCPWVHRAHRDSRLLRGDLDFVEAPATQDPSRIWQAEGRMSLPTALWVETGDDAGHGLTIRSALDAMLAADPPLLSLVALTHNNVDYFSPDSPQIAALRGMIHHARQAADERGLQLTPATLGKIREAFFASEAP